MLPLYENGLIGETALNLAALTYESYKALVDVEQYLLADDIGNGLLEALVTDAGGVDVYDIRYKTDPTDALGDLLSTYLNDPKVKQQLNAGSQEWQQCGSAAFFGLLGDIEQSVANLLPDLLEAYQVMNYNGDKDVICNYIGTVEWTKIIDWPGQNAYNTATNHTWIVNGATAGYYKSGGNLTHVVVYNAGHMSPFNQPQNTLDLLNRFIAGGFKP